MHEGAEASREVVWWTGAMNDQNIYPTKLVQDDNQPLHCINQDNLTRAFPFQTSNLRKNSREHKARKQSRIRTAWTLALA